MSTVEISVECEAGERCTFAIAAEDASIATVLAANGFGVNTRCGRRGLCHACEVELREGVLRIDDRTIAAPARIQACKASFEGPATIYIPARARAPRDTPAAAFNLAVSRVDDPLFEAVPGRLDAAFAVDIGTTTVDLLLVDLPTGGILSRAGGFNAQLRFGDNVITRIDAARDPEQLEALRRAIQMETIQPLLVQACQQAGRSAERIAGGVIAGNTTMMHLLVGEDPTPLGTAPFTPRFITARRVRAADLNLAAAGLAPDTPIQLLPGIAAYIGADIMAGIAASGMAFDPAPSLLVDIGTNGEIALQAGGKLTACATAAGPAFEGCGLRCGMPAQAGAVHGVHLRLQPFELQAQTVGDIPLEDAGGICGSGYVDFLATARSSGLLALNGRFDSTWEQIPDRYKRTDQWGRAVNLTASNGAESLHISEADVALLLQAKAAIGAGIEILLEKAGISASELGCVYLAGGFGMHLNIGHAIAIGLLPGIQERQVRVMGNSALAGAYLALVDRSALDVMETLRTKWSVVDLNLIAGFEERYIEHMHLP